MVQYREIRVNIDCSRGLLVSDDGTKINRDDMLPRLILADEVIMRTAFVNVHESDGNIEVQPAKLSDALSLRIIGDFDYDDNSGVMFSVAFRPEKSDLSQGVSFFHIKTNSVRFKEALKNHKSQKCEFVILGKTVDPMSTMVLAKDYFIAESRPCETYDLSETLPEDVIYKAELQSLLDMKSPIDHIHTGYAEEKHTHLMADITDFTAGNNADYKAGTGIEITDDGIINCTLNLKDGDSGVTVTDDGRVLIGDIELAKMSDVSSAADDTADDIAEVVADLRLITGEFAG